MESRTYRIGPGFLGSLTIVFVVLKALGYIDWSWWWVFSPLWLGIPLVIIFVLLILFIAVLLENLAEKDPAYRLRKLAKRLEKK